jgi:hypothetical protein
MPGQTSAWNDTTMNPLRRISDQLREMRWAQVSIELLLLVLGILIALAVDDWVQSRRDARMERDYLQLLVRDLERDDDILKEFIGFEELQTNDGIEAYRALRTTVEPADREAVARKLSRLTSRRTLRLVRATYTDLVSTGNLRLISNSVLRDRVVKYYEETDRRIAIVDRNNQFFVDQSYAAYLSNTGLVAPRPTNNLPANNAAMGEFAARLAMPVAEGSDPLWRLSTSAPEYEVLVGKVWQRTSVSFQAINNVKVAAEQAAEMRQAIGAELATRWRE